MKIYVAGHRGMVGSAIIRQIEAEGKHQWIGRTRAELDLLDRKAVFDFLSREKPDAVIIAAAKVGGIIANNDNPVSFLTENLQIELNLIDGSHQADIEHLVFLGSSCIYPKHAPQPIKEEYLLSGELEPTNEAYALAKIAGLKLIQAYRKQFGRAWISLMPTNLYGPGDNFDHVSSHVIPGMITKFQKAKQDNSQEVVLWGTGSPLREFLFVDDLANATLFALENYSGEIALNVGSGQEISIKDLSAVVATAVGFQGKISWDKDKPDGTPRKFLDSSKLLALGWKPTTTLEAGLQLTLADLG